MEIFQLHKLYYTTIKPIFFESSNNIVTYEKFRRHLKTVRNPILKCPIVIYVGMLDCDRGTTSAHPNKRTKRV